MTFRPAEGGPGDAGKPPAPPQERDELEEAQEEFIRLQDAATDAQDAWDLAEGEAREVLELEADQESRRPSAERITARLRKKRNSEPLLSIYVAYRTARTARNRQDVKVKAIERRQNRGYYFGKGGR